MKSVMMVHEMQQFTEPILGHLMLAIEAERCCVK
jgi:hypothetical protein